LNISDIPFLPSIVTDCISKPFSSRKSSPSWYSDLVSLGINLCHKTFPEIASKKTISPSLSFLFLKNVQSQTRLILDGKITGILTLKLSIIFLIFLLSKSISE
jgi:hypothetical protein